MGKNSKISWCTHTFNPWWGCTRVSAGCEHCYAETFATRMGLDLWGVDARRKMQSDRYWMQLEHWNETARRTGERATVFVASMADIFENRVDLIEPRVKFWLLAERLTALTFLVLTKRPENIERMVPVDWLEDGFPLHIWLGVTVENMKTVRRIKQVRYLPAHRFVSVEPMLGPVDFGDSMGAVEWVICGGESGPGCRPMDVEWARALRDQCQAADVPIWMKQLGGWPDKRDELGAWPLDLQVQEKPEWKG